MYVSPASDLGVATIAGRRIGGAVERNRARRVLREAWRMLAPRCREGHHIVLVARPEIAGARSGDLMEEVGGLLARANVIP